MSSSVKSLKDHYASWPIDLLIQRGILNDDETIKDLVDETINSILQIDSQLDGHYDAAFEKRLHKYMQSGTLVLGTPLLTNLRREGMTTAACTVINLRDKDGRVDINHLRLSSEIALNAAIGTGYDLSETEDPVSILLQLNTILNSINNRLIAENKRPVASMATLRADHPKISEFIQAKRLANFADWRLNTSVFVTEKLFMAARLGLPWQLIDNNGQIIKTVPAMSIIKQLANNAWFCGEPGILFIDRINHDNPTPQWKYTSTAPCAEVAMAEGEACQFSYINVGSTVKRNKNGVIEFDHKNFIQAAKDITRLLDAGVEKSVAHQESVGINLVGQKRRIGVGITGFADLLIHLRLGYGSAESIKLASEISELLDYGSKLESVRLAQQRGSFPAFSASRYCDKDWIQRKNKYSSGIITDSEWSNLHNQIHSRGIRHSSTTAIPPTGTSSVIAGTSHSLEPLQSLINSKKSINKIIVKSIRESFSDNEAEDIIFHIEQNNGIVKDKNILQKAPWLMTAQQIDYNSHINIQSSFQRFLDESVSKTINMPEDSSPTDVTNILFAAYTNQLKGITVFRDNCLSNRR